MAVPKRRQSSSRSGKRRSHDALKPPNVPRSDAGSTSGSRSKKFICPHCKQIKRPHTVCHNCGQWLLHASIPITR